MQIAVECRHYVQTCRFATTMHVYRQLLQGNGPEVQDRQQREVTTGLLANKLTFAWGGTGLTTYYTEEELSRCCCLSQ